jgi:hypothetical protein
MQTTFLMAYKSNLKLAVLCLGLCTNSVLMAQQTVPSANEQILTDKSKTTEQQISFKLQDQKISAVATLGRSGNLKYCKILKLTKKELTIEKPVDFQEVSKLVFYFESGKILTLNADRLKESLASN